MALIIVIGFAVGLYAGAWCLAGYFIGRKHGREEVRNVEWWEAREGRAGK